MELPDLGKQCSETTCNQLDFLPFVCECGKQFCSDHFSKHVQTCEVLCKQKNFDLKKIENTFTCSHENCRVTSIIPLICDKCKKHFCIKHRHVICGGDPAALAAAREKYAAHQKQIEVTKALVDEQIENKIAEAKKKEKSRGTANKVQLMRIKSKATGVKSVPLADRLYFNVHVREASNEKIVPVFVSKSWSLGRAVDAVAAECKLQNNNNKTNAKKLRLFKQDSGKILATDMAVVLTGLLQDNVIFDGEDLVIEYVDDNCEQI